MKSSRDTRQLSSSYFNRPLRNPMMPISLPDLIDKAAQDMGNQEAYCFKYQTRSAESLSFLEVKKETEQLASALIELGLSAGDKVALAGDNCLDWLLCELAIMKAGLVCVRLGLNIEPEQIDIMVAHFKVRMLIFYPGDNNEYFHKLQSCFPVYFKSKPGDLETGRPDCLEHVVMMIRSRTQSCTTLGHLLTATFHQRKVIARQAAIDPDDIAVIIISPGSNNAVRCVGHTHFTIVNQLSTIFSQLNPTKEDKVLVSTPLSGRSMDFYLPLVSNVTIVAIRGYKMSGDIGIKFALRVIEREKINAICFGPLMLEEFVNFLKDSEQKELFLHWGRIVGDLSQETFKLALNFIPGIVVIYGMLENLAIAQTCMHDFTDKKLEYTGVPTPGTELKIVGTSSAIAAINEIGEIAIRSPYNYKCVDNKDSRLCCSPLAQLDENGWLRTGDVGFMTGDGHIRVMGVKADVIERGNNKHYARVIQEVLQKHPHIENAAIVGVPDKLFQQKICAFITPLKGTKAAAEMKTDKLKAYCEQRGTLVDYFIMHDKVAEMEDKAKLLQIAIEKLNLA